jgi:hypothetical protein
MGELQINLVDILLKRYIELQYSIAELIIR